MVPQVQKAARPKVPHRVLPQRRQRRERLVRPRDAAAQRQPVRRPLRREGGELLACELPGREAWGGQSWRQFNYEGDRADRFWRIKVKGRKQSVQQGFVGEDGDAREQEFQTSDAAMQSAVRKIRRQAELGYYEVTLASSRIRAAKKRLAKKAQAKAKATRTPREKSVKASAPRRRPRG